MAKRQMNLLDKSNIIYMDCVASLVAVKLLRQKNACSDVILSLVEFCNIYKACD